MLKKQILFPIFLLSGLTIILVWTNNLHNLHYKAVSIDENGPTPLLDISRGIWYWIHTAFFYAMLVWGIALMMSKYREANELYRRQTIIILIGALVPWVINLIYLLGFRPYEHIDLTPYGFMVTAFIVTFGLIKYKMFGLVPFARNRALNLMHEGYIILDNKNRILDLNEKMLHVLDTKDRSKLSGKCFFEIWPEEQLHHCIREKEGGKIIIEKAAKNDKYYFEVSVNPFGNRYDEEEGALLLFWDITRHKHDAQRLTKQASNLEELNTLKNKLISIISHDLRSPLASLKQMLDLIAQDIITEQHFNKLLPKLSHDLRNTTELMNNLLSWTKSQLEGEKVEKDIFNIIDIINANVSLLEGVAYNKGIKIHIEGKDSLLTYSDKNMIDLVVRNLLSNAIKFSTTNSKIFVTAEENDGQLQVAIKDQGVGIPVSTISGLFKSTNISTSGTQNEKGTGIGLMLCKDFLDKNDGKIGVESVEGQGSTFHFTLPLATMDLVAELMAQPSVK